MSSLPDIEGALFHQLISDNAVTALVELRIFNQQAPADTPAPYVVFYTAGGGISSDTPRQAVNWVVRIEGIATSRATAQAVQWAVFAALHLKAVTLAGWGNYWLACEQITTLVETVEGSQYWRYIADYRLKADRS